MVHDEVPACCNVDIAFEKCMMRELERCSALDGNLGGFDTCITPVVSIAKIDVRCFCAFQFHRSRFDREASDVGRISRERPSRAFCRIVVNDCELCSVRPFVRERSGERSRSRVSKCRIVGSRFIQRCKIADARARAGAVLIDDTPFQIVPVEVE